LEADFVVWRVRVSSLEAVSGSIEGVLLRWIIWVGLRVVRREVRSGKWEV
jgi:hypothetical protein